MTDQEVRDAIYAMAPQGETWSDASNGAATVAGNFASGAYQTLSSLGLGYLTRRLDIDLSQRAATTGSSQIKSNQSLIDNRPGSLLGMSAGSWGLIAVGGLALVAAYLVIKG